MFVKRFVFVFLLLAALSSLVGTAVAQSEPQQFVVVYVEFKPANARTGGDVLQQLEARAEDSAGVIRFDVLQQTDRPNFFALFEVWSNAQTFEDFQNSSETQAILTQLTPLLEAPLDQRPGNLLTGTVNPRSRHAQARQIFVITHVDVDPQFVPQAQPPERSRRPDVRPAQPNADPEPLSAHRDLRRPGGIRRPRERAAHCGPSDEYRSAIGCAIR